MGFVMEVTDERRNTVEIAVRGSTVEGAVVCDECNNEVEVFYAIFPFVNRDLDYWADVDWGEAKKVVCESCLKKMGFAPDLWARRDKHG
jgi:hypothetical protein